mmetsp:Transcript_39849/g.64612  ORF Transcript_39849/g.64612 Transcript_39849/m.64612 type:complete len:309 (+) Transcript_39849:144-1070(+)|eukprot:CAMPEP_0184655692 /NCGR_PEP_ID=MMETSP0308-20130426/14342_1 /TAXON_ID=38269 /ORGANISM="Gloeochaete witrockiana, Strain SAG 46.84" /LENGTH=308 /DNA_ID=CAMNT_0027092375 /DNA_START=144 /DNA_END=1070 /DNA_ORIENTATION=-
MADGAEAFDPSKKKKKKASKKGADVADEPVVDEVAEVAEGVEKLEVEENGTAVDLDFTGKKKKKKKGVKVSFDDDPDKEEDAKPKDDEEDDAKVAEEEEENDDEEGADGDAIEGAEEGATATEDIAFVDEAQALSEADRKIRQLPADPTADYPYMFLLARMTDYIRANNPELGGERKRFSLKPPQVVREGTKKVVWINFPDICQQMHREPNHVLAFVMSELGTSGSLDANQRLAIKGRFNPKQIENVLRRYIAEFVQCQMCRSFDTTLTRDPVSRLFFLRCEACGSQRSVTAIKQGFLAQIGKRKKQG